MKKRIILFIVLFILMIGIGGIFMFRHFILGRVTDRGGMENPFLSEMESEEIRPVSETADLVSFHWHQSAMSYDNCFTFWVSAAGQDLSDPRLYCDYTDIDTYERILLGDDCDVAACPPVPLERWAELADFLRKADLPAYQEPDPNLMDATISKIQVTWRDGDEQFTNSYNGIVAHDLQKLLQDIAGETRLSLQETETENEKHAELPSQKKEVGVRDLYNEEGSGTSDDGFPYNYSFHVPQIEDDTPDAAAINREIASSYGEIVKECLESVQNKETPYCSNVEYESFRSGDILSLVLKYAHFYDGFEGYTAYSYDTAKGVQLSNEDILKMQNMTEADCLSVLRRAAAKDFDDAYHAAWGDFEDINSGGYQELRIRTISERNLRLDLPFYLEDGVLHVIAPIGSIAGAEYLSRDLTLEFTENAAEVETVQLGDYLTVMRRGNTVTLRLQQTPQLQVLLGEYGLSDAGTAFFDKDLTINGLYGSYTKIVCGEIGETDEPFVFLLTEEGRVDYIDVLTCLQGGYFCGGGPLPGVANVKNLTQPSGDGLPDICAVTGSGEQVGLWNIVSSQRYIMGNGLLNCNWCGSRSVSGTETSDSLTLMNGNGDNFLMISYDPETDTTMNSSGNLTYLGMTEKGAVYTYRLWGEFSDGPGLTGVIALDQQSEFNGDDSKCTLTITELGGTPFLGKKTGDMTILTQRFDEKIQK